MMRPRKASVRGAVKDDFVVLLHTSPGDALCQLFNNQVKGGLFQSGFGGLNHFNNPLLILVFVLQSYAIRLLTMFQNLHPNSEHGGISWSNR